MDAGMMKMMDADKHFVEVITGKISHTEDGVLNIFYLEKFLISYSEWVDHKDNLPENVWNLIANHIAAIDQWGGGCVEPMGLGYKEETGYFLLGSGQGPGVIWMEKPQPVDGPYPYDGLPIDYGEVKLDRQFLKEREAMELENE